jgi:hypothetical protein
MTHLRTWDTYYHRSGTGTPNPGYDYCGRIAVYLVSQDIATNTSLIEIRHYTRAHTSGFSNTIKLTTSTSRYRANNGSYGGTYQSVTKDDFPVMQPGTPLTNYHMGNTRHTVTHNSDGTARLYVNGSNIFPLSTRTSSFNVALPTIPRATTISSFTRDNITLNSFRVNWSTAHTVDRVEYRINGGAWTLGQSGDRTSGNFTVSGRSPNTTYQVQIRVRRKDNGLWTNSSNVNVKTLNIATLNSVPNNINLENPFTITFNRNGASNTSLGIYDTAGSVAFAPYRIVTGTSYTFELTEEEKNSLFNDMSTVNSKSYNVYLNTNDNAYRTHVSRTFVITNANPIFSNFEYEDINPLTLDLTGNNQTIIKGYSNLKATITSANKMEAIKGANPKEYQLVVGSKQIKQNYHASNDVDLTINAIDNNVFIVYAIDSRGNSTQKQISPATYIDYFKPVISELNVNRENNNSTLTNLSFSGTFFNANFGAVTNDIEATYFYKKTNAITNWEDLPVADYHISSDKYGITSIGIDFREIMSIGDEIRVKSNIDSSYIEYMVTQVSQNQIKVNSEIMSPYQGTLLEEVQYKPEWSKGSTPLDLTINGNDFSFNGLIAGDLNAEGFNIKDSFEIKVIISDELEKEERTEILVNAKPNLDLHKEGTSINNPYDEALGNGVQLNGDGIYYNGILLFGWNDEPLG